MGGGGSTLTPAVGPLVSDRALFPDFNTPVQMASMAGAFNDLKTIAPGLKLIPKAGGPLVFLITVMVAADSSKGSQEDWVKEQLTGHGLRAIIAEFESMKASLERLKLKKPGSSGIEAEISYCVGRSIYLLNLFENKAGVYWSHPLASFSYFALTVSLLDQVLEMSSLNDEKLRDLNTQVLDNLPALVKLYVKRFIIERTNGIVETKCDENKNHLIEDAPWTRPNLTWYRGFNIYRQRYGLGCSMKKKAHDGSDDPELKLYQSGVLTYKTELIEEYFEIIQKMIPTSILVNWDGLKNYCVDLMKDCKRGSFYAFKCEYEL